LREIMWRRPHDQRYDARTAPQERPMHIPPAATHLALTLLTLIPLALAPVACSKDDPSGSTSTTTGVDGSAGDGAIGDSIGTVDVAGLDATSQDVTADDAPVQDSAPTDGGEPTTDAASAIDVGAPSDGGAAADTGGGTTIGTTGGQVKAAGAVLHIPAGALTKPVAISLKKITTPAADKGFVYTTDTWALEPDGLQLSRPVTLTLTYDKKKLPNSVQPWAQVVWQLTKKGRLMAGLPDVPVEEMDIHDTPLATVDEAATTVSVPLLHFSNYVGGVAAGGLHFQTQQSGPDALRVIRRTAGFGWATARANATTHIVVHHTDGAPDPFATHFNTGWNAVAAGSPSAQFWVGRNGVIGQTVALGGLAYHGPPTNDDAPGIEMINDDTQNYPLPQQLAMRRLVGFLARHHNIPLRGRWQADWPAGARSVPPGFSFSQNPPAGASPPHYDRVLGHREIDQHVWLTRAYYANYNAMVVAAGANAPSHIRYTSSVNGYFIDSNAWACRGGWGAVVNAGNVHRRVMPVNLTAGGRNDIYTCFKPTLLTNNAMGITITAQAQRQNAAGAWINVGGQSSVTYQLNNAANAAAEGGTNGLGQNGWRPGIVAGRRRRDPGGTNLYPFTQLMSGLAYGSTGIIEASGGDSYGEAAGGDGGKVTLSTGHAFAANTFDAAEALYTGNQNPATDEAGQAYIKHVASGATESLAGASHDFLWLIVEGTLELPQDTTIRAALGIYVAPGGKIIARSPDAAKLDGFKVQLETLGEALIYGLVDTAGKDAPTTGPTKAGGKGGEVIIRQLAADSSPIPTIISRGGDTDEANNAAAPQPPGGKGGEVTITATGADARIVLSGGQGAGAAPPRFVESHLAPAPPIHISTKMTPKSTVKTGVRPVLFYDKFTRGICTSGGMGGAWVKSTWDAGSKGGEGGKITINAASIAATGAALWTGAGLEHFLVRIPVNKVTGVWPAYVSYTGSHGGVGRIGHSTKSGGDGGDGGDAGDVAITGAYYPVYTASHTVPVMGWDGQKAQDYWDSSTKATTIGTCNRWTATVPGDAAPTEFLRICTVGGSGGHPGGSHKLYSGNFGKKGTDGTVTGAPP